MQQGVAETAKRRPVVIPPAKSPRLPVPLASSVVDAHAIGRQQARNAEFPLGGARRRHRSRPAWVKGACDHRPVSSRAVISSPVFARFAARTWFDLAADRFGTSPAGGESLAGSVATAARPVLVRDVLRHGPNPRLRHRATVPRPFHPVQPSAEPPSPISLKRRRPVRRALRRPLSRGTLGRATAGSAPFPRGRGECGAVRRGVAALGIRMSFGGHLRHGRGRPGRGRAPAWPLRAPVRDRAHHAAALGRLDGTLGGIFGIRHRMLGAHGIRRREEGPACGVAAAEGRRLEPLRPSFRAATPGLFGNGAAGLPPGPSHPAPAASPAALRSAQGECDG